MIRRFVLLAATFAAAPALAVEGGPIRSGEHADFSRLVLPIEPETEWNVEARAGGATLFFPGKALNFGTAGIFDRIPRSRIRDVRSTAGPEGTLVEVDLGCACRIGARFVDGRVLAFDVVDPGAEIVLDNGSGADRAVVLEPLAPGASGTGETPQAADSPEAPRRLRADEVASAERSLIEQFERAARQGLIQLSDAGLPEAPGSEPPEPEAPAAPRPADAVDKTEALAFSGAGETVSPMPIPASPNAPEATVSPALPLGSQEDEPETIDTLAALARHEQVEARTVFDRDGQSAARREATPPVPSACLGDARMDVASWTDGQPLHRQIPALSRLMVGEFDRPNADAIGDLARLYIRYSFGVEAGALLTSFDVRFEDRALLLQLARAVEAQPLETDGPLTVAAPCPGRHGLWQALGGAVPAFRDAEHFRGIEDAFAEMPPDLRNLLGPRLAGRLLDEGRPEEARRIHDITRRPGQAASVDMQLIGGRLAAAEGDPVEGVRRLNALVEKNAYNSVEALTYLVKVALEADLAIPDRVILDLRSAALEQRRSEREPVLRALLARALARKGELAAAIEEILAARRDLPDTAPLFEAVAASVLAAADPGIVGPSLYARTVIEHAALIGPAPENDGARRSIAGHLLDLGLANAALDVLRPATARGEMQARLLAAEAHLRLGAGDAARDLLDGLPGTEAAGLRARAYALAGEYALAVATLEDAGLKADARRYVWPSGEWKAAREAAGSPERAAMATYMAARTGQAPAPAPSENPDELAPTEAFQEPLPPLDRPSLGAARSLLATSRQVGGFVEGLLKPK